MWNDNELLKSVVMLELAKALHPTKEVSKPTDPPQPWPERRRFWHRRVRPPSSKIESVLGESKDAQT